METIEKSNCRIQRLPRWIKRNEFDLTDANARPDLPYFYLLLDFQEQVRDREIRSFYRSVQKINDLSRLEDASLFLRELRAGNETLIFHRVDIIRDGRRLAALNPENISVYRRERKLRKHIVNDRVTVCHSMDDLRVGDLLDVQVTELAYANEHPTAVKQYLSRFWLSWNCVVLRQNIRIVNRSRRTLVLHHHAVEDGRRKDNYLDLQPQQECERQYSDLSPKTFSSTAPEWLCHDFLQLSPRMSWKQVSRYFHAIYARAAASGGDLDCREIDRIALTGERQVDALRVIRFVQNEIRYLSEGEGIYSHTPRSPRHVLRRGAGDCKGKATLAVALLASIGVDANSVLVDSSNGEALVDYQPSSCHFSHVILRVILDGKNYYFDPTLQHQAGDFEHAAQLKYGYALNLTTDGEDLVELPCDLRHKHFEISHLFDLRDAGNGRGKLVITRKYYARQADEQRAWIAATESTRVEREYFERAEQDINLDLEVIAPFTVVEDNADKNLLVTRELYAFTGLDDIDEDDKLWVTTNFHHGFPYPDDKSFELQIDAGGRMEHHIEVHYPYDIEQQANCRRFSGPGFRYLSKTWSRGQALHIRTRVTPLREVVDQASIESYYRDARRLYRLRHNGFPIVAGRRPVATAKWPFWSIQGVSMGLALSALITWIYLNW